jgi:enterochelin esterase-like enzyme
VKGPPATRGVPRKPHFVRSMALRMLACLVVVGFVAGGLAGTVRYVQTFWLYRGFPAPSIPRVVRLVNRADHTAKVVKVPHATLEMFILRTPALGNWPNRVYVVLPPGYAQHPHKHYPVVYLLDGTPASPTNYLTVGDLVPIYDVLLAKQQVRPMILVDPSGSFSLFGDEEWANGVRPNDQWETFVSRYLVNEIDTTFRGIDSGASRAIAGYSEGGYGALNIGLHHPTEFRLMESWSGYMLADDMPTVFGDSKAALRFNSPQHYLPDVARTLRSNHSVFWMYDGAQDAFLGQNYHFEDELRAYGIAKHFVSLPGGHSWTVWRSMMPAALVEASKVFGGARNG